MVKCSQFVGGPVNHECSLSEYEKLGNSKERRPGENIHLTSFGVALKVEVLLVACCAPCINAINHHCPCNMHCLLSAPARPTIVLSLIVNKKDLMRNGQHAI